MSKIKEFRKSSPRRVPFGMMFVMIGVVLGMLAGLVVELSSAIPSRLYMQLGGIAGFALGTVIESVRYWWRNRKRNEPSSRSGTG